jgi:preprotein translocase subunit SecG
MYGFGNWLATILLAATSLIGLILWSHAKDDAMAIFGGSLLFFGVAMVFRLITHAFGNEEKQS